MSQTWCFFIFGALWVGAPCYRHVGDIRRVESSSVGEDSSFVGLRLLLAQLHAWQAASVPGHSLISPAVSLSM